MPPKNLPAVLPGVTLSQTFLTIEQRIEKVSKALKGSLAAMTVYKAKEDLTSIYVDIGDAYLDGQLDPMEVGELFAMCSPFHMAFDLYFKK